MGKKPEVKQAVAAKKKCFVACPIGEAGTDVRRRTDGILDVLIRPVAEERGYEVLGSHEDFRSGPITYQIVEHLVNDELVIADLTDVNANVVYEVAIRHAARKPIILVIQAGQEGGMPFDLNHQRVLPLEYGHWDCIEPTKARLAEFIADAEENPESASRSPVGDLDLMKALPRGEQGGVGEMVVKKLLAIETDVGQIKQQTSKERPAMMSELGLPMPTVSGLPGSAAAAAEALARRRGYLPHPGSMEERIRKARETAKKTFAGLDELKAEQETAVRGVKGLAEDAGAAGRLSRKGERKDEDSGKKK